MGELLYIKTKRKYSKKKMKKIEYKAPEMEVIKLNMQSNVLAMIVVSNGGGAGVSDEPGDGSDAG